MDYTIYNNSITHTCKSTASTERVGVIYAGLKNKSTGEITGNLSGKTITVDHTSSWYSISFKNQDSTNTAIEIWITYNAANGDRDDIVYLVYNNVKSSYYINVNLSSGEITEGKYYLYINDKNYNITNGNTAISKIFLVYTDSTWTDGVLNINNMNDYINNFPEALLTHEYNENEPTTTLFTGKLYSPDGTANNMYIMIYNAEADSMMAVHAGELMRIYIYYKNDMGVYKWDYIILSILLDTTDTSFSSQK